MAQIDTSYEGFYAHYEATSKKEGSLLMGPDNLIGDDYQIAFKTNDDGIVVAWISNKFDAEIGYFDVDASRKLQLAHARGQSIRVIMSFVAYSDLPDPGHYWGEMAVFCFNPAYAAEMNAFIDRCAAKMVDGIRPDINLGNQAVAKIFSEENWLPSETVPFPKTEPGSAILKDHQSMSEKMIEQGRARNKGCYVVSWAFIILVVIGLLFGLHALGLF